VIEVVGAGNADRDLARVGLHVGQEALQCAVLALGWNQQDQRIGRDARNRRELFVSKGSEALRDQRQRRTGAHADGVAIRLRIGDLGQADRAGGAGHVFHDHLHAVFGGKLGQRAGRDVVGAARVPRHDEADFLGWERISRDGGKAGGGQGRRTQHSGGKSGEG
jgi:hypothetical protein